MVAEEMGITIGSVQEIMNAGTWALKRLLMFSDEGINIPHIGGMVPAPKKMEKRIERIKDIQEIEEELAVFLPSCVEFSESFPFLLSLSRRPRFRKYRHVIYQIAKYQWKLQKQRGRTSSES